MDNSTNGLDLRNEALAKWEISVLTIILITTVIGNSLVLVSLYLRRYHGRQRKLTRMYFFVMHLSIADLISGIFNVLPQLAWDITFRFQGGAVLCKIVKFVQPLGNYLSSYILTVTAVDRYHAICHPLSYCRTTSRRSRLMVYSAWCFALILCVPQLFIFSYQKIEPNIWDCWASFIVPYGERTYVTWFSVMVFLLPFVVLLFTYIAICIEIWGTTDISTFGRTDRPSRTDSRDKNRQPLISRARINTVKQMITVVSLYAVTCSPFIGCQLWATWDPDASDSSFLTGPIFTILALMSSLTSCVNPWIYLGFNRELRLILLYYMKNKFFHRGSISNFDNDLLGSYGLSNGNPTTKSSFIGAMFRCAGSMYRGNSSRDRSTIFTAVPEPLQRHL